MTNETQSLKNALELIRFHLGELDEAWINSINRDNDEENMIIGISIKQIYMIINHEIANLNKNELDSALANARSEIKEDPAWKFKVAGIDLKQTEILARSVDEVMLRLTEIRESYMDGLEDENHNESGIAYGEYRIDLIDEIMTPIMEMVYNNSEIAKRFMEKKSKEE